MQHDGPHDPDHPYTDAAGNECFGCRVKGVTIDLGQARSTQRYKGGASTPNNSWERGIAGEHRPDGSFMPYVHADTLSPIGIKEYGENRTRLDAERQAHRAEVSTP